MISTATGISNIIISDACVIIRGIHFYRLFHIIKDLSVVYESLFSRNIW